MTAPTADGKQEPAVAVPPAPEQPPTPAPNGPAENASRLPGMNPDPVPAPKPDSVTQPAEPEKRLSKRERREKEAEAKEAAKVAEIRNAIDRALPKIKAILDEEGLEFAYEVRFDIGRNGEVRLMKSPVGLRPDMNVWG